MAPRTATILGCVAAVLALAGCGGPAGGGSDGRPGRDARLTLDFTPNGVHAGIYLAMERGYDEAEGVTLQVDPPSSSTDSVKLLLSGRTDLAILDIHDLALAREKGRDIVGVMALVQAPLAAILAQPSVRRPRDLEGRRVGVTGLPSDEAVLDSIVSGDGGDPAQVRRTTIGFTAVPSLLAREIDAATAFWNVEGLALKARRPASREFRVDDFGAPSYPELVMAVNRTTLQDDPALVRATVRALRTAYERAIDDPEAAISALVDANPDLRRETARDQLEAVLPEMVLGGERFGTLSRERLERWAAWEQRFGIVERRIAVDEAFSPSTSTVGH